MSPNNKIGEDKSSPNTPACYARLFHFLLKLLQTEPMHQAFLLAIFCRQNAATEFPITFERERFQSLGFANHPNPHAVAFRFPI